MSEKEYDTSEMDKAKIIVGMIFITNRDPAEVLKPGKYSLDLPSSRVSTQNSPILRSCFLPITSMRGDHLDSLLGQTLIQRITVVGSIPDQSNGELVNESSLES